MDIFDVLDTLPSLRTYPTRPAFAARPVAAIAVAAGLVTAWAGGMRPYQYDELYFRASGEHLAWGFADQPPLVPLWAHLAEYLAPGSALLYRLPAALLFVVGIVATAAIAREFGGGARAQTIAAGGYAGSLWLVVIAQWSTTYSFDPHLWTVVLWLVVRAAGRPHRAGHRELLCAGLVTAVDLQVKFLVPVLWAAVLAAAFAVGPRWLLRRRELWVGLGLATALCVPTLYWQATHGWPYVQMQHVVASESPRATLVPVGLLGFGVVSGMVLAVHGLCRLLRSHDLAAWRFLGVATVGSVIFLLAAGGRSYYLAGFTGLLFAASAVGIEARTAAGAARAATARGRGRGGAARWWTWAVSGPALAASALACLLVLPLGPPGWNPLDSMIDSAEVNPSVTAGTQAAYAALSPVQRAHTAVIAQSYPLASAIDAYTTLHPYSPHRGYWYFGEPPATADAVIWLGDDPTPLRQWFDTVTELPTASGPPLWEAHGRRADWTTIWPSWRRML